MCFSFIARLRCGCKPRSFVTMQLDLDQARSEVWTVRSTDAISRFVSMRSCFWMAVMLSASLAAAQSVPQGWKTAEARYTNQIPAQWEKAAKAAGPAGSCQIAIPPDWKTSTLADGRISAEAASSTFMHPFSAELAAYVPGPTFAEQVQTIKKNDADLHLTGITVVEDSPERYWETQKPAPGTTEWDITVPGRPNCHVTIQFPETAANEATARKIAMSLSPAK